MNKLSLMVKVPEGGANACLIALTVGTTIMKGHSCAFAANRSKNNIKTWEIREENPSLYENRKEINAVHTVTVRELWMDLLVEI
jgi:hypothetical protein